MFYEWTTFILTAFTTSVTHFAVSLQDVRCLFPDICCRCKTVLYRSDILVIHYNGFVREYYLEFDSCCVRYPFCRKNCQLCKFYHEAKPTFMSRKPFSLQCRDQGIYEPPFDSKVWKTLLLSANSSSSNRALVLLKNTRGVHPLQL